MRSVFCLRDRVALPEDAVGPGRRPGLLTESHTWSFYFSSRPLAAINDPTEVRIYKRNQGSKKKERKYFFFSWSLSLSRAFFLSFFLDRYRFFLIAFLVESVFSCFLTFLFSFINSHLFSEAGVVPSPTMNLKL